MPYGIARFSCTLESVAHGFNRRDELHYILKPDTLRYLRLDMILQYSNTLYKEISGHCVYLGYLPQCLRALERYPDHILINSHCKIIHTAMTTEELNALTAKATTINNLSACIDKFSQASSFRSVTVFYNDDNTPIPKNIDINTDDAEFLQDIVDTVKQKLTDKKNALQAELDGITISQA